MRFSDAGDLFVPRTLSDLPCGTNLVFDTLFYSLLHVAVGGLARGPRLADGPLTVDARRVRTQ